MKQVLLILLFISACVRVSASNEGGSPKMVFERTSHDFGDVKRKGGDIIAMFRFENKGDAPLIIKKVHKSCSCMNADYSRKPILPGEGGEIKIKYELHKVEPGIFNKVIQIYTNESKKVHLITIQGNSMDK
ncbi:MAG: DUF1573 domain-containing protein [Alistipes sp.]|nr:DUF1573 domain-containing protein [Alistipes sp.]MBO7194467.1 DUF1573 domain-containing protein [Alistipes sp.]